MIKLLTLVALTLTVSSNLFVKADIINNNMTNNINQYDDGMYYATMPEGNGNFNPEIFIGEDSSATTFSYVPVIPPANDPDVYVSNEDFLYNYYYHLGNNIL